jgi:cation diffusion facilitator CzcD-associated flavoprotein CzcO
MATQDTDVDVLVVGAGITGIYQLYRLRAAGFSVRVLEAGSGVGGTWFWNRYPNARSDSEIYSYAYFFDKELLQEWDWSEHFAPQPETERYLNHVVDRFGLRPDIQFDARVTSAVFDDETNVWTVRAEDGTVVRARFLVPAVGILSAPYFPELPGRADYQGEVVHTGRWPLEPVHLAGRRVAVIGTGASAVQMIPAIAAEVESLTVYQRTANWATPLNNSPITPEEQAQIKATYDELYATCHSTFSGFMHLDPTVGTFDHDEDERRAHYDQVWNARGLAKLFGNYTDLMIDPAANQAFCDYIADRIRSRVTDPAVAEMLIPKDHGFGMKRPPLENGYYEAFNRPNVTLIDLRATPIEALTPTGIRTAEGEREFDLIIFATGFDAVTGALTQMGIQGSGGTALTEYWADGPRTYLGLQIPGFPNLLMAGGPHGTYGNIPRSTETQVDFITDLLVHLREQGYVRIEPDAAAEEAWTAHIYEAAAPVLTAETAWYLGSNIPGKAQRFLLYIGGLVTYREKVTEVAAKGYEGFQLTHQLAH